MADRTSSSISVAAGRPDVLRVISAFDQYPGWATGIKAAEVLADGPAGRPLRVRFVLDAGIIRDSYVLEYQWDDESAVRWQLAEPGSVVTEMTGAYLLADAGTGTTVRYELAVGTRLPMLGLMKRRAEKTIIDTALKGLKARVESTQRADFDPGQQ